VLSRKPAASWPDGVLHHGVRVLLLFLVAALITSFFPPTRRTRDARF
jgi:hypothetical protein